MPSRPSDRRVARKEIIYEQDARYYHAGELYSGWADSEHHGFREELEFRDGFRWGPARVYNPDGRLIQESHYRMDLDHGFQRSWNDQGRLEYEAQYEHGILRKEREWDDGGNLIKDFELPDDDLQLLEMRRSYGAPEQIAADEAAYRAPGGSDNLGERDT
jgi:hypothetical protein